LIRRRFALEYSHVPDAGLKRSVLFAAALSSFLTPFMGSAVNVALPDIQKQFQIDAIVLSWIASAYILATAIFLIPFGRIGDIYGRKKIFIGGIFVYGGASLFCAAAPAISTLLLFRIVQGVGSAMIFATGIAILTSVFPPEERGRAIGINIAAVYTGLSLGPFLGGFLTQHFTWRSVFFSVAPLSAAAILVCVCKLKGEWAEAKHERLDIVGSVLYGAALAAIMIGFSELPSETGVLCLLGGAAASAVFLRWETKAEFPVIPISLFRYNRTFAFSNLAALIHYSATFAATFILSLYLQYIKEFTPETAGLILAAQPIVMAIFSPLAGNLSDRVEPQIIASLGMGMTSFSLFVLAFLHQGTSTALIAGVLIWLGFGYALFSSPNTNAIMSSVEKKFYGVASGAVGSMRMLGQMTSMGIAAMIFALYIGKNPITPENYPLFIKSADRAFLVFALLCFGGIFASLARGNLRER